MATSNPVRWETLDDQGTVLGSEWDGVTAGSRTAAGTEFDNTAGIAVWGWLEQTVDFASAPASTGYLTYHMVAAPDGTNYEEGSASVDPGPHTVCAQIPIRNTTDAIRRRSKPFRIPPMKIKLIGKNDTNQSFPASGSVTKLYTSRFLVETP